MSLLDRIDAALVSEKELSGALETLRPTDKVFISIRSPTSGDSAGNVVQRIRPPAGYMYRVLWVQFNAINDATVADRYPVVRTVIVDNTPHLIMESTVRFAASTAWRCTYGNTGGWGEGAANGYMPLPELYVNYNEGLEMLVVNGQAGDVYTARAFVERIPSKQTWSATT